MKEIRVMSGPWFLIGLPLFFFLACSSPTEEQTSGPILFEALHSEQTGVNFINQLSETEDFNIIQYLYYYNGGGVAAGRHQQ